MSTAWKDDMASGFPASAGAAPARVEPMFFSSDDQTLFGCYHRPQGNATGRGLVLVSSLGHEYIQFHRVFRQLAYMLGDAGDAVLRFDLTGCGDSSGDERDWSFARWRGDLSAAIEEVRRRADLEQVGVVGLRLGGSLAMQLKAEGGDLDRLVLWDPIVRGPEHLVELDDLHGSMVQYAHVHPRVPDGGPMREVLGFPLPPQLVQEIEGLDLLSHPAPAGTPVMLVETNPNLSQAALVRHLSGTADFQHESFDNPHLWQWIEDFAKVHVPHQILRRIVSWSAEAGA